jgi:hypothetical protein
MPTHNITNTETINQIHALGGIRSHGPNISALQDSKLLVRRRDKCCCHVNRKFVRIYSKLKLLKYFTAFQSLRTN